MNKVILGISAFWFLVAVYYFVNMQFVDVEQFRREITLAIALSFCSIFSLIGYLILITTERETK